MTSSLLRTDGGLRRTAAAPNAPPSKRLRFALEAGVTFVLLEGMLRRLLPDLNVVVLGFKFLYFPLLYIAGWAWIRRGFLSGALPGGTALWFGWGLALTGFHAIWLPGIHILGAVINLMFVPIAWLGAALYPDRAAVAGLIRRSASIAGLIGLLGIIQTQLPPNHWLNVSMDFESQAISIGQGVFRISSTFQHCNVFGSYVCVAALLCAAAMQAASNWKQRTVAVACLLLVYVGGTYSGSRMAAVAPLLVVGTALARNPKAVQAMALAAAGGLALGVAVWVVMPQWIEPYLPTDSSRAFSTTELLDRTLDLYLGEHFSYALEAGGGLGTGWGVYTMGVAKYAEVLHLPAADAWMHIESGYAIIVAQLGIVGVICFLLMHADLFVASVTRRSSFNWVATGVAVWSLIGHIPVSLFEFSVLAVPYWLVLGVSLREDRRPAPCLPPPGRPARSRAAAQPRSRPRLAAYRDFAPTAIED